MEASQKSNTSTYCSELERGGAEDFEAKISSQNYLLTSQASSCRRRIDHILIESVGNKTYSSTNPLDKKPYPNEGTNLPIRRAEFNIQFQLTSKNTLQTPAYTQSQSLLTLSQKHQEKGHTNLNSVFVERTNSRRASRKSNAQGHKSRDPERKGHFENRIFQTEENSQPPPKIQYKSSRKSQQQINEFDTVSITSEFISNIVDNEIQLHQKRKQKKSNKNRMRNYVPSDLNKSYRHARNAQKTIFDKNVKQNERVEISNFDGSKNIKYMLTMDHVQKIADHLKLDTTRLSNVIELVLTGFETVDDDTSSLVDASQSPIQSRYSHCR